MVKRSTRTSQPDNTRYPIPAIKIGINRTNKHTRLKRIENPVFRQLRLVITRPRASKPCSNFSISGPKLMRL